MRTTALSVALLAAVLALPVTAQAMPVGEKPHLRPRSNAWEARVIQLTNDRRRAHGVKPLKAARCPDHFAEPWARHMATTHQLVHHSSLDPLFKCPHTNTAGENIAEGFETPRAVVRAWMSDKGHRDNLLNPDFHRIGVAAVRTHGVTFAIQDFIG
jgi:uncharacterized protein YkwD